MSTGVEYIENHSHADSCGLGHTVQTRGSIIPPRKALLLLTQRLGYITSVGFTRWERCMGVLILYGKPAHGAQGRTHRRALSVC